MAERIIAEGAQIGGMIANLADFALKAAPAPESLMLVGIQRRGADLARRIAAIAKGSGLGIALGVLDINLYRDDWTALPSGAALIGPSRLPCSPDGRIVLLVDDVLFTGRTVRAAMEAILDYGRPARIELLALVDRGHRELPVCADCVGIKLETRRDDHVDVLLAERDGRDAIILR